MARIPVVIASTPTGTTNPAAPTGGRSLAAQSLQKPGPALSREHFPSRAMNRTQAATRAAIAQGKARFDADHNKIDGVSFWAGGTAVIKHGLGRAFTGFHVVNVRGGYGAFHLVPNGDSRLDATQIQIASQNNCQGDVVVY